MREDDLQELKEWHENDEELHQFQIDKLIEVAERFNTIQKENAKLSIMLRDTQRELFDVKQQNKRYRKEIKEALEEEEQNLEGYESNVYKILLQVMEESE